MTMFVTKYALTAGIQPRDDLREDKDGYVHGKIGVEMFKLGRDVFRTRDEAVKAAEAAREKKISSLQEQIRKLNKLTFS